MNTRLGAELERLAREHRFPPDLLDALRARDGGGGFTVQAKELGARHVAEATRLLAWLVKQGLLTAQPEHVCARCDGQLGADDLVAGTCPDCGPSAPLATREVLFYERPGEPPRLAEWIVALHGMNTRGAWQEALAWTIAKSQARSVPVFVYKYGIVRPGVLFRFRQRQLRDQLAETLRRLREEAKAANLLGPPDVVAHSFGTFLLAAALEAHPDLAVGRVILLGSIVRPDFRWQRLLDGQQVERVLNCYGTKDLWARLAEFAIPDSGPSGRRGFDVGGVIDRRAEGYRHSEFFHPWMMARDVERIWKPFLAGDEVTLAGLADAATKRPPWRPPPWPFYAGVGRWLVILLLLALLGLALAIVGFGLAGIVRARS